MNTNKSRLTSIANLCNIAGVLVIIGCVSIAVIGLVNGNVMSTIYGLLAALVSALPWFALAATMNALHRVESKLERIENIPTPGGTVSSTIGNSPLDLWRTKNPGKTLNDYYAQMNPPK